jgi:hypothetical protein
LERERMDEDPIHQALFALPLAGAATLVLL